MSHILNKFACQTLKLSVLCLLALSFNPTAARAGLALEMNVIRYHQYGYYFFPNMTTNNPPVPFGDYFVASSGYPTNGSSSLYRFNTNGFNQVGGGSSGYGDFDGMMHELTNGLWSIFVTNTVTTNVYRFKVTALIKSNDLPYVNVTFPADGSVNVTNRPTFTWQGPTNYSDLVVYYYNNSTFLPITQTSLLSATVLYQGPNDFTPHYDSNSVTAVVSSIPTNSAGQPISAWVSTAHLQDYSTSTFIVGQVDPSGTAHTLVAHYPWDATNFNGTASGADISGNNYNMNFAGSFGSQGGVNSTTTTAVGARAIQFHDGDGGSAGYVGWNPTPAPLLTAFSGSFSISCWIKTTQNNFGWDQAPAFYGAGIVSADNSGLANDLVPLALTGSKIGFNTGGSDGDITLNSMAPVNDGNYHHVVVTRNQLTGQKVIYIDGVLDSFSSGSTNLLNDPQLITIGAISDAGISDPSSTTYGNGYDGLLDDLQIYAGVLSSNEVAQLYANPGSTAQTSLGDALDSPSLSWNSGGDLAWFVETTNTHDNVSAAQSGAIADNQESWIETTVVGPGTLSFWWNVSSEDGSDYLEFLIDGNTQNSITGTSGWQQQTYPIVAGSHTLRWRYYKDSCCIDGLDAGFLDQVSYITTPPPTNTPPVITINPFSQTNHPGYNVALFAAATSNVAITWQWYKVGGPNLPNATNALYIPTNSGTAGVAGNYFAIATNIVGSATTSVATVTFQNAALPPDWSLAFRSQLYGNGTDPSTNINLYCMFDSAGNLYTLGSLSGTNTFGSDLLISANGVEGSTFLKQTATGTPIWGRCMTNNGNGHSFPRGIAPAPGDGFYAVGLFSGTNWLGTNKLVDTANGSTYLARFDANGSNLWVRTITGTNFNFPNAHTLVSDAAGNVTLSSLIWGYTSFGTTNLFFSGQQGVLAQYDLNGNLRWVQAPSSWPDYLTYSAGRIYGCMGINGTMTNYIGGVTNVSDRRRALYCLNATNGQGIWVRGFGAFKDQGSPSGFGDNNATVAVSGTNLFVVGTAYGTNIVFSPYSVDFAPDTIGGYFARYDTNGTAQLVTTFGSRYIWPWAALADNSGNVYVGADFDTYAIFGSNIIAAPFHETVQFAGNIDNRIPGQTSVSKFDRNGNPLWARLAQSPSSYLNLRDIALAPDGVWACGFFNPIGIFGNIQIAGILTCVGSPFCTLTYHQSGYMAKITETTSGLPVTLLNPQTPGANFQFQFNSQSGFTHAVQYRTNLIGGLNWQTYSNVTGDGSLKTILVPRSLFNPSQQGFIRVSTQ